MTSGEKGRIYLSGGGDAQASFPLDSLFFKNLPPKGRLLYLPIALKGNRLFDGAEAWFRNLIALHNRASDLELETWSALEEKKFSNLERFDGIFVGGGNTWSLMKDLFESGFHAPLVSYIKNNGIYYGGSAGAIICGARIDTQNDENKVGWDRKEGLNLLNGLSVACHVNAERISGLKSVALGQNLKLLALGDNAGAVFSGTTYQCVGTGFCKLI